MGFAPWDFAKKAVRKSPLVGGLTYGVDSLLRANNLGGAGTDQRYDSSWLNYKAGVPQRTAKPGTATPPPPDDPINDAWGGGSTGPTTSGRGTGTDLTPAQVAAARQGLMDRLGLYESNYNVQNAEVQREAGEAEGDYAAKRPQLVDYYKTAREDLSKDKSKADVQRAHQFAARGAYDSSTREEADTESNDMFRRQYGELGSEEVSKLGELDRQITQIRSNLTMQKMNFDISQYNSLEEVQSALEELGAAEASLSSQQARIRDLIKGARGTIGAVSPEFDAAKSGQQLFAKINQLSAAGASKREVRGYIRNAFKGDEDKIKYWLDYFQTAYPGADEDSPALPTVQKAAAA